MDWRDLETTYKIALNIVNKASAIFQEGFNKSKKITIKTGIHDIVTQYDNLIEDYIKQELKQNFPTHNFLGEETSKSTHVPEGLTWILDPIDGTSNFAHSSSDSAISLALTHNKEPIIGITSCPILQKLYSACKGKGSFLNGTPIHTSSVKSVRESIFALEISCGPQSKQLMETLTRRNTIAVQNCHGMRSIGSAAISLAYVAQGIWDVYHAQGLYPWDYAAGTLLIREAGGHVTNTLGEAFNIENSSILAANNATVLNEVVQLFKSVET